MDHVMSPTGVAVLLLLALVVDYMSVGPNSIRDRLAFLLAVPAIREGFNGSPLDRWTVDALTGVIEELLDQTGGAYIAGASVNVVLGAGVGCLFLYTVGCLLPVKASKRLGRFAALTFPASSAAGSTRSCGSAPSCSGCSPTFPAGSSATSRSGPSTCSPTW